MSCLAAAWLSGSPDSAQRFCTAAVHKCKPAKAVHAVARAKDTRTCSLSSFKNTFAGRPLESAPASVDRAGDSTTGVRRTWLGTTTAATCTASAMRCSTVGAGGVEA